MRRGASGLAGFVCARIRKTHLREPNDMPIYEYICDDCGTKFEKLVRRNQDAIACPSCGESHLKTALSTFAAHSSNGKTQDAQFPTCAGGMCQTPDFCGRN
jgi:putative FmdB family regulatory protein